MEIQFHKLLDQMYFDVAFRELYYEDQRVRDFLTALNAIDNDEDFQNSVFAILEKNFGDIWKCIAKVGNGYTLQLSQGSNYLWLWQYFVFRYGKKEDIDKFKKVYEDWMQHMSECFEKDAKKRLMLVYYRMLTRFLYRRSGTEFFYDFYRCMRIAIRLGQNLLDIINRGEPLVTNEAIIQAEGFKSYIHFMKAVKREMFHVQLALVMNREEFHFAPETRIDHYIDILHIIIDWHLMDYYYTAFIVFGIQLLEYYLDNGFYANASYMIRLVDMVVRENYPRQDPDPTNPIWLVRRFKSYYIVYGMRIIEKRKHKQIFTARSKHRSIDFDIIIQDDYLPDTLEKYDDYNRHDDVMLMKRMMRENLVCEEKFVAPKYRAEFKKWMELMNEKRMQNLWLSARTISPPSLLFDVDIPFPPPQNQPPQNQPPQNQPPQNPPPDNPPQNPPPDNPAQ